MEQQQLTGIETPHDHDVLSGRGNYVNYHVGNEHFRALVRKYKVAYVACPKPQKGKFSKMIVDEIRSLNPPGRFLKQDAQTKLWHDIGEKKSLDKTRQALREGAPEIMKEIVTEDHSGGSEEQELQKSPATVKSSPESPLAQHVSPQSSSAHARPYNGLNNSSHHYPQQSESTHSRGGGNLGASSMHSQSGLGGVSSMHNGLSVSVHSSTPSQQQQHQMSMMGQAQSMMPPNSRSSSLPALLPLGQPLPSPQPVATSRRGSAGQIELHHPGDYMAQQQQQQRQPSMMQPMMAMQPPRMPLMEPQPSRGMPMNAGMAMPTQANLLGGQYPGYQYQSKLTSLNEPEYGYVASAPPPSPRGQQLLDDHSESEQLAPLPTRKRASTRNANRRNEFKREGSEGSLQVDSLFSGAKTHEHGDQNHARNYGSSAHLSLMSLSISDMQSTTSAPTEPPRVDPSVSDPKSSKNPDNLSNRFNNSLRLGRNNSKTPPRRTGSGDGHRLGHESSDLGHVMDMSVATLGDQLSQYGDMSIARMSESQANMSFSNVFEETDKELFVNQR